MCVDPCTYMRASRTREGPIDQFCVGFSFERELYLIRVVSNIEVPTLKLVIEPRCK